MLESFFKKNNIKPNIKEIHLGGGTPSHLTVDELSLIIGEIKNILHSMMKNQLKSIIIKALTIKYGAQKKGLLAPKKNCCA